MGMLSALGTGGFSLTIKSRGAKYFLALFMAFNAGRTDPDE